MFLFIEKKIREGLSQVCSKRRAHTSNKYLPYYVSNPSNYLMHYDVNNQYGWAMSQYLPYGDFKWVDTNIDIMSIHDHSPEGYILEVDLEYPKELHNVHQDLPFLPEHLNPATLRPCAKKFKLMATLQNKDKYVIYYRNLKQAIKY
ncbi:unnamed protein product [Psylliodes chrysocephalus]|uniref:DNA-directed DNA polymerase n=1 Tax=Psylliodes chrysocephalus TaxID=3402493 RepID=A0A9P0CRV0_9CUCU|nr:unnamed protein product [Psylliodes chrysocephala]